MLSVVNAGLCKASISMAIVRVSILNCMYCTLFSILRRWGLSETQLSGANSTNGIAWLCIRGLTLSCSQQEAEFTSRHNANMLI